MTGIIGNGASASAFTVFGLASIVALAAFVVASSLVPVLLNVATSRKLLDYPDQGRHRHARPVARLGGVAVFAGLIAGISTGLLVQLPGAPSLSPAVVLAMAGGGTILFLIGLFDDIRGVPPLIKLGAQAIAAAWAYAAGFRIELLLIPPAEGVALGWLAFPVTVLWLVGVSNAFNLVDGIDGLAGAIALIALVFSVAAGAVLGNFGQTWYAIALGGALLGFLRHNRPPARIFLGDSGSLVVGFLIAVLTVRSATRMDGGVYAFAPIFALSYPLLDTGISILRRWLRGAPLSRADARHVHHQLQALGLSPHRALLILCAWSTAVGLLGLFVTFAQPELTLAVLVLGGIGLAFVFVYGVRWLHYHEFTQLGASVASAARQARSVVQDKIIAQDLVRTIECARSLDALQAVLREHARDFRFVDMRVRVGASARPPERLQRMLRSGQAWRLEYPITPRCEDGTGECLFLDIWCATGDRRNAGAERIAGILHPAITSWAEHARPRQLPVAEFGDLPVAELPPQPHAATPPPSSHPPGAMLQ